MIPKSVVVFCLSLFLSCGGGGGGSSVDIKIVNQNKETNPPPPSNLEIIPSTKIFKVNESFIFSATGGIPPYTFTSAYKKIDSSSGLYTFTEGFETGDVVQAKDSFQNVASSVIFGDFSYLWTWVSGSSSVNQTGSYGTKGVASQSNVPGARYGANSWADSSGNLWLFGGVGYSASESSRYLNDLWKFNTSTNQWTWVSGSDQGNQSGVYGAKGVASSSSVPGGRYSAVSWVDPSGNFWLFGGYGYQTSGYSYASYLNDLWKFNPTTNQWTWVSGSSSVDQTGSYGTKGVASPSNVPGARYLAVGSVDPSGNFWLFGGHGYDTWGHAEINDLWKFNPTTNQWTWVSGSNSVYQYGTYGTKGSASTSNVPGARYGTVSWVDPSGNFWLFGGIGKAVENGKYHAGILNDLWKFNPTTNQWTWVSGSNSYNQSGTYGTKGVASPSNVPGMRVFAISWVDPSGNFWLFGGNGNGSLNSRLVFLNDLWKFNTTTNQWTWVSGSDQEIQSGVYGAKGVASSSSVPGGRYSAVSWVDPSGNFWLFGGYGSGSLNDLWKFTSPK